MGTLFSSEDLVDWLHEQQGRAVRAVAEVDPLELRFDPAGISARVVGEFAVDPLALDWEAMTRDDIETVQLPASRFGEQYVVNGFSMTIHVPFTGSVRLFKMAPSSYTTAGTPDGAVYGHQLLLDIKLSHADPSAWQSAIDQLRNNLNNHVGWVNDDVARGRIQLQNSVDSAVSARKANLDAATEHQPVNQPQAGQHPLQSYDRPTERQQAPAATAIPRPARCATSDERSVELAQ